MAPYISPRYLTKSRFKLGRECPVKLFYYGKDEYPSLNDNNDFLESLANGGFQVGELAKCYFPEGHDIAELDYKTSLHKTNHLLKNDNVTIFEAALKYDNFFLRADILHKDGKVIDLIEVKAKSFNPEKDIFVKNGKIVKKLSPYLEDIAFQMYVAQKVFPEYIINPYLMLADKSKTATVNGLNQIFRIKKDNKDRKSVVIKGDVSQSGLGSPILTLFDVSEACQILLNDGDFVNAIHEFSKYYKNDMLYPSSIKYECKNCEYKVPSSLLKKNQKNGFQECWKRELGWDDSDFYEPSIFEIWNFRKGKEFFEQNKFKMKDIDPKSTFGEIPSNNIALSNSHRQHIQIIKTCYETDGKEVIQQGLFKEMDSWKFPLHFIDFETTAVAIPFYKGQRPYEQVAFQFSCHTLYKNGRCEHSEWLNKVPGKFPNFEFVRALKNVLEKDDGTIFRYSNHENFIMNTIDEQLKNDIITKLNPDIDNHAELREWIKTITKSGNREMVDLLDILKKYYYHPATNGSNSIKNVLPAILSTSKFVKNKYSKPYNSNNFKDMIWWVFDKQNNCPYDPYKLLPSLEGEVELFNGSKISAGGLAMEAYNALQFVEMSEKERNTIIQALLQYCELDTLAILMIYEHWDSLRK